MLDKLIEKKLEYAELFDAYGSLLTKKQREILNLYFFDDLSYTEIADLLAISKQAVHDAINKSLKKLNNFEENIGYIELKNKYEELLENIDK